MRAMRLARAVVADAELQVLRAIVVFDAVAVMNLLALGERPPENCLHDFPMLVNLLGPALIRNAPCENDVAGAQTSASPRPGCRALGKGMPVALSSCLIASVGHGSRRTSEKSRNASDGMLGVVQGDHRSPFLRRIRVLPANRDALFTQRPVDSLAGARNSPSRGMNRSQLCVKLADSFSFLSAVEMARHDKKFTITAYRSRGTNRVHWLQSICTLLWTGLGPYCCDRNAHEHTAPFGKGPGRCHHCWHSRRSATRTTRPRGPGRRTLRTRRGSPPELQARTDSTL